MKGSIRGGVFGGNAGLWLFQKRFRKQGGDNVVVCRNEHTYAAAVKDQYSDNEDSRQSDEDRDQSIISKGTLQLSRYSITTDTGHDYLVTSQLSVSQSSDDEAAHVSKAIPIDTGKVRKRRVFGVRKRHFDSNGDVMECIATGSTFSKQHPIKKQCTVKTATESLLTSQSLCTSDNTLSFSVISSSSGSQLDSKKCNETTVEAISTFSRANRNGLDDNSDSTNVPSIPSSSASQTTMISRCSSLVSNTMFSSRSVSGFHSVSSNTQKATLKQTQESESSSVFNFDKDSMKNQLGCKTDLDIARLFFSQLDSDETALKIEDVRHNPEPPSVKKHRRIIRTTRRKLPPNKAQEEYHKYCEICRSTSIKPLSMIRFLEQRSEHFRAGEIYDGMFDE